MSDAMRELGWVRADRRRTGMCSRWKHASGWVMRTSWPCGWALFDPNGQLVRTGQMSEVVSYVATLDN